MASGGFYIQPDKAALRTGKSFMDLGYKNFITEINNLNDRMGTYAIPMVKLGHGLDLTVVRAQLLMDLPEVIRTCKLGQTGNI